MPRPLSWWRNTIAQVLIELRRRRPFDGQAAQSIANAIVNTGVSASTGAASQQSTAGQSASAVVVVPF